MSNVPITFACGLYDRMQALYTGEVKPQGIDLNFLAIDDPRQIFDRMGKSLDFDAAEMSSSDFITRTAAGRRDMVAIPVFPSRVFRHGFVTVNRNQVKTPKDLEGKRIGTPIYTQTAAVIIRGMLQDEYGVDFSRCHWVQGATNNAGTHGAPGPLAQLPGLSIEQNASGRSLSDLLAAGEIQAIIGSGLPDSLKSSPNVRPAVSRLPRGRDGILPEDARVSGHASRRLAARHLRAQSVHRQEPVRRDDAGQGRRDQEDARPRHAALHAARAWRPSSTKSTTSSAAIAGPTASSPTGRRSRRWCDTWRSSR